MSNDSSSVPHYWHLWAKTEYDQPDRWHPLINHLLEVGAVAQELWETAIPPAIIRRWTVRFGGDQLSAGSWLACLAGLHDLGKASPVFQGASHEQRIRLTKAGIALRPRPLSAVRHGAITASALPSLLQERWPTLTGRAARRYAVVSGMHHGAVLDHSTFQNASPRRNPDQVGTGWWQDVRRELFRAMLEAMGELPDLPTEPLDHALATWAAGFVTVADWIGSNTTYFPFGPPVDEPKDAYLDARLKAQFALSNLGWRNGAIDIPLEFNAAFPSWTPNTAQQATMIAVRAMDGPGAVIVEAPMGDGKTEAAWWSSAWAQGHWGARGMYVAMPTRASSDQLFGRLAKHLTDHASGNEKINALLLHGHAAIRGQLQQLRQLEQTFTSSIGGTTPDQPAESLLRAEWFTARRRGLLAPYGVGTVDQTLLGILENRHYFVRLHGLTGKTVIFDEVHAYDTYMETLFVRELEALGALGAPVVILSATLPSERRQVLLNAYALGAGWTPAGDTEPARYPRVTTVDRHAVRSTEIAPSKRGSTVALRWFTGDEDAARSRVVDAVADALDEGGTCAVICNTVNQAQEMYARLEPRFPGEVDLFHARYRYMDRARRQDHVLRSFGKDPGQRPPRRIVVATQVIEQSLDLDFDLMVSYFCPTDLLIQRLGRLHRHSSNTSTRPQSLIQPQLWILGAGDADDATVEDSGVPPATRYVYDPHVLLRSWAVLRRRTQLVLPGEIETCIERTYSSRVSPPADLKEAWLHSEELLHKSVAKSTMEAHRVMIPSLAEDGIASGSDPLLRNVAEKTPEEEQAQELHVSAIARTRLGPPSVDVVVLTQEEFDRLDPVSGNGKSPLPLQTVAELISRSVSISLRGVYRELMARDPPRAWQRTTWLNRHRLVTLDDRQQAHVGNYVIELSPSLGIVISQPRGPEEE